MTSDTTYSEPAVAKRAVNAASGLVIAAIFAPLGLLANARVRRFILAITVLGISLPLGRQLGYREAAGNLGSLGGLLINVTTIGLIGVYVPLLMKGRHAALKQSRRLSLHPSVPLAVYVAFAALSLLVAKDLQLGAYEIFMLIQVLLLHVYVVNFLVREEVLFVIRTLLIGLAIHGLLMVASATAPRQLISLGGETVAEGSDALEGWLMRNIHIVGLKIRVDEKSTDGSIRVGGVLGSPNDAAGFLSVSLMLALGVLAASVRRWDKILAAVAFSLGSGALIFTLSRGGWTAFALGLLMMGGLVLRRGRFSARAFVAVALAVAAGCLLFSGTIASRLEREDEGSASSRLPLLRLAALMIEDHPLLGVGANNFPLAMEPYLTRGFSGQFIYCVHNKYLLVWSETGLGALAAFVWFLFATLRRGIRCWRYKHTVFSPIALGCVAGIVGHMFHMSVDVFRGPVTIQLLCLVAGLIAVLERLAAQRDSAAAQALAGGGSA